MNKKIKVSITIVASILILCGVTIFFYPMVSNLLSEVNQSRVIQDYSQVIADEDKIFYEKELQKAKQYNAALVENQLRDPFVPGTCDDLPDTYLECLNVGGVMGYLEIPKIDVRLPIYHGTSEDVLEKGVGHLESTALPVGGDFTHAVLTGHRGLPSAKLFTDLDQLKIGDQFYIHVLNQVLAYEVDEINVVEPENLQNLAALENRDLVTLITCTPYAMNTHRLLVRGTRVPYEETETAQEKNFHSYLTIGAVILILLLLLLILGIRRKKVGRK